MAKKERTAGQDLFTGGLGVVVGLGVFFTVQMMLEGVAASDGGYESVSAQSMLFWNGVRIFGLAMLVAGFYYLARGFRSQSQGGGDSDAKPAGAPLVECPVCREQIRQGALKCRFCGTELGSTRSAAVSSRNRFPRSLVVAYDEWVSSANTRSLTIFLEVLTSCWTTLPQGVCDGRVVDAVLQRFPLAASEEQFLSTLGSLSGEDPAGFIKVAPQSA